MSQLQNCSVKCTKNGSYCENVKTGRKSQGERGMCTKNGSCCEKEKSQWRGVQGRCERRSEAFVKIYLRDSRQEFAKVGVYFPFISCCGFTRF